MPPDMSDGISRGSAGGLVAFKCSPASASVSGRTIKTLRFGLTQHVQLRAENPETKSSETQHESPSSRFSEHCDFGLFVLFVWICWLCLLARLFGIRPSRPALHTVFAYLSKIAYVNEIPLEIRTGMSAPMLLYKSKAILTITIYIFSC